MEATDIKLWDHEIPYLSADAEVPNLMTFYRNECKEKLPCILVFPGGGYSKRADYEGEPVAHYFVEQGFHACVVQYRIKPNPYPAPLADAQRAAKLIRAHAEEWGVDADRIFMLGFSAGAHLASYAALAEDASAGYGDQADSYSHRPNGVILCYPMLSAKKSRDNMAYTCFSNIVPAGSSLTESDFEPIKLLTEDAPPHFIWHTAKDSMCTPAAAMEYASRLCELHVNVELHLFPGGGHGGALRKESPVISKWASLAVDFVHRNGLPQ